MSASVSPVISAAAAAMGRKGARVKWSRLTGPQRAAERKRAWRTRRRKSKRRKA